MHRLAVLLLCASSAFGAGVVIDEPETTLVLLPDEPKEILFVRDRNPRQELWTGKIPTHDEVSAVSGIRTVESSTRAAGFLGAAIAGAPYSFGSGPSAPYQSPAFPAFLRAVRDGRAEVWVAFPSRRRDDPTSAEQQFASEVARRFPDVKVRDATPILRAMRVIKNAAEVALLERAIQISDAGQKAGMKRALTANNEYEVQATIEYTFRNMGACCWGYPSIVASGANATTLHYIRDDAPIARDGLILSAATTCCRARPSRRSPPRSSSRFAPLSTDIATSASVSRTTC